LPEIQNPNLQGGGPGGGSGGDMRSSMMFMLLLLLVFFGYEYIYNKPPQAPAPSTQTQSHPQPTSQAEPATQAPAPSTRQHAETLKKPAAPTPSISASLETDTTVENELYKIVLTNRGAQVKHWILKKYMDEAGKPLDLVQQQASARFGNPLELFTYEPALTSQLNDSLYQVTVEGAQPSATGLVLAPATLVFRYAANGLDVVKTIHFDSTYVVSIETKVTEDGAPVRALVEWPAGLGDMAEFAQSSMIHAQTRTPSYFAWAIGGKDSSQAAAKVSGNDTLVAPYQYAAVMDLYFAAAFLPDTPENASVVTLHNSIDLPSNLSDPSSKKTPADVLGMAMGSVTGDTRLRLFAGPKATDVLSSIHATGEDGKPDGPSLDPLIQFGWTSFLAKPLYLILRFMVLHGIGSWGWAIIISTVVFNVGLLPTRITSMKSSLKTMRMQPKLDAIKKRYANLKFNDPKRAEMQQEQMALMKAEGVNMYGSCLPMLVPLILLWPYYRVLECAVELRQAHWMWLHDLSQPDPTYILPILIIVTMFLTQYITPSPGMDPAQRRMMAFMMPIFFGFMLLHYASGLALYWCTGNIIMLTLQIGINRSHWGREMHELAARRGKARSGRK
jgi:YidC/Oxa1 family membrane protein insertase